MEAEDGDVKGDNRTVRADSWTERMSSVLDKISEILRSIRDSKIPHHATGSVAYVLLTCNLQTFGSSVR